MLARFATQSCRLLSYSSKLVSKNAPHTGFTVRTVLPQLKEARFVAQSFRGISYSNSVPRTVFNVRSVLPKIKEVRFSAQSCRGLSYSSKYSSRSSSNQTGDKFFDEFKEYIGIDGVIGLLLFGTLALGCSTIAYYGMGLNKEGPLDKSKKWWQNSFRDCVKTTHYYLGPSIGLIAAAVVVVAVSYLLMTDRRVQILLGISAVLLGIMPVDYKTAAGAVAGVTTVTLMSNRIIQILCGMFAVIWAISYCNGREEERDREDGKMK